VLSSILIASSDRSSREVLAAFLAESGYQVQVASDGREAEALLRLDHRPIHGLLTELSVPPFACPTLIRRAGERFPPVAVVLLFPQSERACAAATRLMGAQGWIQKPINLHELLQRLVAVLPEPTPL
jgi:DNA-binding response OmpR family regulator